ncbi:phosphatidylinositol-specific phospholipase C [Treponema sp.]|uniref:phosphatidylinositol-specific phospholipase C n=1 Tax=Treponema sp. TaxID=166 RepID=UPI0025DF920B|nr:phosphatidylinositol-specific phospholipase C [Treponema sp.]MCR5217652.1 phosphatidylinositol-specific phospholipase C [Treponema sp.]
MALRKFLSCSLALLSTAVITLAAESYTSANWMSQISDSAQVSAISIPGTHDSGATYESVYGTAKCQSLSITDQLEAGVRYLDIRCRNYEDAFVIHHGSVYQHLNFDDVLTACQTFLSENPTETIIMSVKEEYDAYGNSKSFETVFLEYMDSYSDLFWTHSYIPSLGDVRGKIVLLRRFSASTWPLGLNASSGWGDNTTSTISYSNCTLRIQDSYKVGSNSNKWSTITSLFNEALSGSSSTLYLNYTSGYKSFLGIPNIRYVSNTINSNLSSYFADASGRYGTVIMDFATEDLAEAVYQTNF